MALALSSSAWVRFTTTGTPPSVAHPGRFCRCRLLLGGPMVGREPVAIVNAVRLVLLAAVTFGLHLTDVQLVASMAALEAVLTLFTRKRVSPDAS